MPSIEPTIIPKFIKIHVYSLRDDNLSSFNISVIYPQDLRKEYCYKPREREFLKFEHFENKDSKNSQTLVIKPLSNKGHTVLKATSE